MKHQWVGLIEVPLTEEQAARLLITHRLTEGYHADQQEIAVGCIVCEKSIDHVWGKPCEGEPPEWKR